MLTKEKKNVLLLACFDVINRLKFNLDVISDKLKRSPFSHLRILLRLTKGFHRLVKSTTGGISFLEMLVETLHEHHGSFVIYWPQGHQHKTTTSCNADHTLILQDSTSSTVTATQDHKTRSKIGRLYVGPFQNAILF